MKSIFIKAFLTLVLILAIKQDFIQCVQLTFELPDNEVQCFNEVIKKGENTVVEFQVFVCIWQVLSLILEQPTFNRQLYP
jgi:hypothetical protein